MSDKPVKSLEQITQDALSSNFGISDADLALLFSDETDETTEKDQDTAGIPSYKTEDPTQQASTANDAETPVDKPAITPSAMPEPRPGVDISELENSLKSANDKIAQLSAIVQELTRKSSVNNTTSPPANPADEVDDQAIITKPKESIMKMIHGTLKTVLPAAFAEYDAAISKRAFLDQFRAQHADFDELRPIMRQIVAEDPANDDVYALPRVYEEAKRRRAAMLESIKRDINIPTSNPVTLDDDLVLKLEQRLVDRIRKRRAASGTLTSSQTSPVSPVDRQTATPKEKPLTEEEKMFLAMLNAGPASSKFLK